MWNGWGKVRPNTRAQGIKSFYEVSIMDNSIIAGDVVECLKYVLFANGDEHNVGDEITVTEDSVSYFRLFTNDIDYRVIEKNF